MKKNNRAIRAVFAVLFGVLCSAVASVGAADIVIPDRVSAHSYGELRLPVYAEYEYSGVNECFAGEAGAEAVIKDSATASILGIPFKKIDVTIFGVEKVIPGGWAFGIKLKTSGVLVAGTGSYESGGVSVNPAYEAGIRAGDIITSVNGKTLSSAKELTEIIEKSSGDTLNIGYKRGSESFETKLTPMAEGGKYKAGMWIKDSTSGIGTVTFITPDTGSVGGLGHGVCDTETGALMPFSSGEIYPAVITGIVKGAPGTPGELRGYFGKSPLGYLNANTDKGVFGMLDGGAVSAREPVPIGLKDEVKVGKATILCTLDGDAVKEWEIEIVKIVSGDTDTKNFLIKVTDPALLELTGGIVQGMSGSPIIQNGKLVGAVTHVLINEPSKGYGIFIENMLGEMARH